ncbi:MAG: helix-turn-helix domain-containing protein [Limosilactobacillus sp.]
MKNRIRECRKAAGMSQAELGNQVGFADNTISNYEKSLREPTLEVWECLASALHVSPAYLVGWSDEKGQP